MGVPVSGIQRGHDIVAGASSNHIRIDRVRLYDDHAMPPDPGPPNFKVFHQISLELSGGNEIPARVDENGSR